MGLQAVSKRSRVFSISFLNGVFMVRLEFPDRVEGKEVTRSRALLPCRWQRVRQWAQESLLALLGVQFSQKLPSFLRVYEKTARLNPHLRSSYWTKEQVRCGYIIDFYGWELFYV